MTTENGHLISPLLYPQRLAMIFGLALLYFLAGRLGLLLAIPPGYATAIFPPAGFALAALLLYGNGIWPGILLGSFALNLSMAPHFESVFSNTGLVALSIAIGATIQGLFGAALIRRFVGFPAPLAEEWEIFKFFMLGGPISCLVNSVIGTSTLMAAGAITPDAFAFNWWTWWVGDVIGVFVATPLVFIAVAKPRALWKQRVLSVALPLLLTLAVVITLFVNASSWESQQQHADFRDETKNVAIALKSDLQVYLAILASIERHFVASDGKVSSQQFSIFVDEALGAHPGLQALEWLPVVKDVGRSGFEHTLQNKGFAGFQILDRNMDGKLIPAIKAGEYVPVAYVEPFKGNESALGYNVASSPPRLEALLRARDTGQAVVTGGIKLVQETSEQFGLLIFLPVYDRIGKLMNPAERAQHIQGYATAVLKISDMLGVHANGLANRDIALRVIDEAAPNAALQVLYQSPNWGQASAKSVLAHSSNLKVGGRTWRIEFIPLPHYLVTHRAWQAWATLAGGLLFTGMLGALLLLITGHTGKVQKIVDERTNELRIILDNVVDGIVTLDQSGAVQSFNRAAETIFGYQGHEIIGKNFKVLMPEQYRKEYDDYLENYRKTGITRISGKVREMVGQRKDGSAFPIDLAVSHSIHHEQPLFICVVRDITERKRIDRMKSEFVSTVSHELRTPLTSISGALGLLAGGVLDKNPEQVKQMVDLAHKNSLRLASLINDLLDMDKLVAGKMELELTLQPLMPLVEQTIEAIHAYGEKYQVNFKLVSREEVDVRVEGSRLIQVLNNFLSNAAKFSPQGGEVEIAVRKAGDAVRVEVTDHGEGVPTAFRERIFQKFSQADSSDTRQKGGTGLGLAISKELIEGMHGVVGFRSEEGKGACFYFELPI